MQNQGAALRSCLAPLCRGVRGVVVVHFAVAAALGAHVADVAPGVVAAVGAQPAVKPALADLVRSNDPVPQQRVHADERD